MPLRLNGSTSGYTELSAPATAGSNTLTLPTGNGTNGQYLQTNGSGALSWASVTSSQWTTSGSNIYYTTGSVGVGTSSPSSVCHVAGANGNGLTVSGGGATGVFRSSAAGTELGSTSGDNTVLLSGSGVERMRIKNNGQVTVGDSNVHATAYGMKIVGGTDGAAGTYFGIGDAGNGANAWSRDSGTGTYTHINFVNANGSRGSITTNSTSTAYNTSSDYRLKENVAPLTEAASRVNQLQVHRFNFIADPGKTIDGFLAHEAQAVVPECVTGSKDEVDAEGNPVYQAIDQSKLVPLLTAALQEALAKIESLETRLAALEAA